MRLPCARSHVSARHSAAGRRWLFAALVAVWLSPLTAQQLLDRVLARVGVTPITLSDVRAAIGLGLLDVASSGNERSATPRADQQAGGSGFGSDLTAGDIDRGVQGLVNRHLAAREVDRFPPPDPPEPAIDLEIVRMKARAGARLDELMRDTGIDDRRLRELARETLRVQAYIDQRFGTTVQVSDDEVRRYYDEHPEEFRRDGGLIPFEEAEPAARRLASDERLRAGVSEWFGDLRARAEVVINP